MQVSPYLTFNGNCKEAFEFYQQLLGGKLEAQTHRGTPTEEHAPPDWLDKILHARLSVGDTLLMGSDLPPDEQTKPEGFSVSLLVDSPEEAERIYKALVEGGSVRMELQQTFWAARFAMLVDRFDIPWIINCD